MGVININFSIFLTLTSPILRVHPSIYQTLHKVVPSRVESQENINTHIRKCHEDQNIGSRYRNNTAQRVIYNVRLLCPISCS